MTETPKAEEAVSNERLAELVERTIVPRHGCAYGLSNNETRSVNEALRELQRRRAAPAGDIGSWRLPLWDAINKYTIACRGDPSQYVYGNTPRMDAVAEVERVVIEAASHGKSNAPAESEDSKAVQRYKIDSEGTYVSETGRILLEEAVKASDFDREVAALQAELLEQCRLLGAGSEREAKLVAERGRMKAERDEAVRLLRAIREEVCDSDQEITEDIDAFLAAHSAPSEVKP